MDLTEPIDILKGVGPRKLQQLQHMGICTLFDLLTYFPRSYEDQSVVTAIANLQAGETATVSGVITGIQERQAARRRMTILTAFISDGTGYLQITWFNQKFLKDKLKVGSRIFATGKITYAYGGQGSFAMSQLSSWEILAEEDGTEDKCGILPVYSITDKINQKFMRQLTTQLLEGMADNSQEDSWELPEVIPADICQQYNLLERNQAVRQVHYPTNAQTLRQARYRLAFEELYLIQCGLLLLKKQSQEQRQGICHRVNGYLVRQLFQALPFHLTNDQQKVWQDICNDMESYVPMRRLLQGDVGSGKTVVAMLALVKTVENGFQGALMAPTEILAHQHYEDFCHLLEPLGVRVALLSGRLSIGKRRGIYEKLAKHEIDIVIGTHALIQDEVQFAALGLAITDEQHRFGINQRALLEQKGDALPDVLVMTATPIPRTLTLTVYGDLDVSMIHQLPPGRKPIRTFVRGEDRRELIYKFVLEEIAKGRQAYVVCPLIESKEESRLSSAQDVYEELSQGIFAGISCGLVHGKLKQKEKEAIMEEFYQGKIKLLVATTVIEVGVNVPNASIMVVEHAQQFGLSQLHQLRGRIGRGEYASYCILVSDGKTENARRRMEIMESTTDGFVLAEEDLKLRGPGQFFGSMQHGLPDLKMADVERDIDILLQARRAALESVDRPEYMSRVLPALRLQYQEQFMNIMEN